MNKQLNAITMPLTFRQYFVANWQAMTAGGFALISIFYCYAGVLSALVQQWWSNDKYSYGFLIPAISVYLMITRRERLFHIQPAPSYLDGISILLLGLALLLIGQAGSVLVVQEFSLLVTLIGVVLLLYGREFFKSLWFPILYLLFMIPIWGFMTDRIHAPFQLFSATLGVKLIQLMGIPAYQDGTFIYLPNITLEVAKACSGVNYLIAVTALGIPMAYLFLDRWRSRALLVIGAVMIAALSNSVRVGLIGTLFYYHVSENVHGPGHILQGLFVAMVGYCALFGGLWLLSTNDRHKRQQPGKDRHHVTPNNLKRNSWEVFSVGVFVSILLTLTGSATALYQRPPISVKSDLHNFPMQIGAWTGQSVSPDIRIYKELGVDQELSRRYTTKSGEVTNLYIGYYDYQIQGKELISYKTSDLDQSSTTLTWNLGESSLTVNKTVQNIDGQRLLVVYWYYLNGRFITNRYLAKALTAWNAIAMGKTNGAVIMLTSQLNTETDIAKAVRNDTQFLQNALPSIDMFLSRN